MKPGIDPKVDYVFKKVFGSESNADVLCDLLEAVLGFPVTAVEIINPFNDKGAADDKLSILDIKAKDAEGRWFDVEIQLFPHEALVPRLVYYLTRLYSDQLGEGQDYGELRPAYSICFLQGRQFPAKPDVYHNHFELVDRKTGQVLTNHLGFHVVELPKFVLGEDELRSVEEGWCYFLKHAAELDSSNLPAALDRPPVRKAMEVLVKMSQDAVEKERYESRLKWERDQRQREQDYQAAQARIAATEVNLAAIEANLATTQESLAAARVRATDGFVGQIHLCQQLLNQPPTPKEELASKSLDELQTLADEYQRQVLSKK